MRLEDLIAQRSMAVAKRVPGLVAPDLALAASRVTPTLAVAGAGGVGWDAGRVLGASPLISDPSTTYDQEWQKFMVNLMNRPQKAVSLEQQKPVVTNFPSEQQGVSTTTMPALDTSLPQERFLPSDLKAETPGFMPVDEGLKQLLSQRQMAKEEAPTAKGGEIVDMLDGYADNSPIQVSWGSAQELKGNIPSTGLPTTVDPAVAKRFAKMHGDKFGVVNNAYIDPSAKIIKFEDLPNEFRQEEGADAIERASRWAKKNGYDAIDMRGTPETPNPEAEIRIFNKDILLTREQMKSKLSLNSVAKGGEIGPSSINWSKVNTFLRRKGYDVRGADDTKDIYSRLTKDWTQQPTGDHLEALDYASTKKTQTEQTKAARYFGYTNDLKMAGYMTPEGKLLDFSGIKQGAYMPKSRQMDHREINQILDFENNAELKEMLKGNEHSNSIGMRYFMNKGNIRMQGSGIDLSAEPTGKQWPLIREHIKNNVGESFYVDISDKQGNTIKNFSYEWPNVKVANIVNDIDNYFSKLSPKPKTDK